MFCCVVCVICHAPKYVPKLFPLVLLLLLFLCLLVVSFVALHMVCEILPCCHHLIGGALAICHVSGSSCCITIIGPLLHVPWWCTTPPHCLMQMVELFYNWKQRGKMSIFIDLIIHFFQKKIVLFFILIYFNFLFFFKGFFYCLIAISFFLFIGIPTLTKTYSSYICIYLPLKRNFNNLQKQLYMNSF